MPMDERHPLHRRWQRLHRHVHGSVFGPRARAQIRRELAAIEEWIIVHTAPAAPRVISLGLPLTLNREGKLMSYQLPSDRIGIFPIRVSGAKPAQDDVFSVTSNNTDQFTAEIGAVPDDAAADAGYPAVFVTCLTHDGAPSVSFSLTDSQGDTAGAETFDIIAPVAPPPPPGTIEVDEAGIMNMANPNPPAAAPAA